MVVHETYKNSDGQWVSPAEVTIESGPNGRRAFETATRRDVTIGSIEKMSKSKKNVVDPDDIIESYGADTARWFMLSDSPPERDVIWSEEGVQGASRFLQKVWRLVGEAIALPPGDTGNVHPVTKAAHKAILAVGEDVERLRFNRCVAHIHELSNALNDALATDEAHAQGDQIKAVARIMIQLSAPMMPHLAEECWRELGGEGFVADAAWPIGDPALIAESSLILPVQINGRKRADVTVPAAADNAAVETIILADSAVQAALDGKPVRKVIVVPKRIVNIVV
jgi:leucyl-tRNA synthetase